ncbi:LuxR C-terminal-related transcriptional regulator [Sphingobacterium corticibacter]|uniref:HTH luxR-type domain-containing protein n=1 Tax=Sphingobacterium corticibacter TaxID=2171749 RepID=A0A2T8HNH4_9SPHI|nr:LuxR C-terminal-related transcriptional regulator [Sphingobacterium corticibacter]PVH26965.1 hypothetical protein DC487_05060 [Sphingobacterium corticibacter]
MNTLFADNNLFRRVGSIALAKKICNGITEYEANTNDRLSLLVKYIKFERIILSSSLVRDNLTLIVRRIRKRQKKARILIINESENQIVSYSDVQDIVNGNICVDEPLISYELGLRSFLLNGEHFSVNKIPSHPNIGSTNPFDSLSANEQKIIHRILNGERVSDIAKTLQLSISTVSTYKMRAFKKLTVENVPQLKHLFEAITTFKTTPA